MTFSWKTPKQEVIDSIKSWGFTFNADKQRWDKGTLNGSKCSKLKVWFSARDQLDGVEAKYEDIDSATSRRIFDRYVQQTCEKHGTANFVSSENGDIKRSRVAWIFSERDDIQHDMIVIARFDDYLLFHAARNMPPLFNVAPSTGE
jgi:hypothetical protein